MLTGVAGKEHVISRVMTGLVAQKRAESATCSRRHAVNLVPLDEFALGEHCFHAVAHICLCHGAHRQAQELGAGGAPSRAAGGRKRPSRHGVSKSERRGTMRHARMSSVSCGSGHTLRRQVRSGRQHLWHCAFLSKSGNKGQICYCQFHESCRLEILFSFRRDFAAQRCSGAQRRHNAACSKTRPRTRRQRSSAGLGHFFPASPRLKAHSDAP